MPLLPGTQLGPYVIAAPLGAGGMGEVYRARDSKLDRDVAVKVLPESVAQDGEARSRFEREAKIVGALSHPNILEIHDFGVQDGIAYAVMELLEGQTLHDKLTAGALPLKKCVDYALQIARGLAAAHEKGIVHRDLKPQNIFVTAQGHVKILDFGLARPSLPESDEKSWATRSRLTEPGTVLGTVGYMSPEQVRGEAVDHRSDLFALGCVLYEMLTGQRAFRRDSAVETMAAILKEEPPELLTVNQALPPVLAPIVEHCLAKDASARVQSARDLAFELELALGLSGSTSPSRSLPARSAASVSPRLVWALAGLTVGAALAGVAFWALGARGGESAARLLRLNLSLPSNDRLPVGNRPVFALSPDGQRVVFTVTSGDTPRLYVRDLSEPVARPLPGAENGSVHPFFSPDGSSVGFWTPSGDIVATPLAGGGTRMLGRAADLFGASWGDDGSLVFAANFNVGLTRLAKLGSEPEVLTELAADGSESSHVWPQVLPGSKAVLFTVERTGKSFDDALIVAQEVATGQRHVLVEGGTTGRYVSPGYLIYGRANTLLVAPFDLATLSLTGPGVPLIEGVAIDIGLGVAQFDVSTNGLLAYVSGEGIRAKRDLMYVDRNGTSSPISLGRPYTMASLSPDGRRIATELTGANNDIWTYEISSGALTRVTFERENAFPVWSRDGSQVIFQSDRASPAVFNLFSVPADGGVVERLTTSTLNQWPTSSSPDGRLLAFTQANSKNDADVWILPLEGERTPRPFVQSPFWEDGAAFSPDGRFLAYHSDESGKPQVYVQAFPGPGPRRQVSADGGRLPSWSGDGREIYFRNDDKMMAAALLPGRDLAATKARELLAAPFTQPWYDVTPDGRFLIIQWSAEERGSRQIDLVLNWPALLASARRSP